MIMINDNSCGTKHSLFPENNINILIFVEIISKFNAQMPKHII